MGTLLTLLSFVAHTATGMKFAGTQTSLKYFSLIHKFESSHKLIDNGIGWDSEERNRWIEFMLFYLVVLLLDTKLIQ